MIDKNNESWMGCPMAAIKDGKRWGHAHKDMPFANGARLQKIGEKLIRHAERGKMMRSP